MRSESHFFGLHTAIVNAAARPQERDTPQTCMLRPSDFNGLPVKISLHGSILLQRRVSQPHFVAIVARRFLITRAAGERWWSRPVRSIFSRRYCLKLASFGIRARRGHVHPTTYLDSPSIRNGGDRVPPNLCMDFPGNARVEAMTKDQTATLYPAVLGDRFAPGPC